MRIPDHGMIYSGFIENLNVLYNHSPSREQHTSETGLKQDIHIIVTHTSS